MPFDRNKQWIGDWSIIVYSSQRAITNLKLTIVTLEQSVKYVRNMLASPC